MLPPTAEAPVRRSEFEVYANVIRALMLRDMRTRFGGSYWGYLVVVLWPVVHIFVMVVIMVFRGVPSPMGNDPIIFVATGAVPALVFQYTSREAMKALLVNRPLMYYPQVKAFDIMVARFLVETIKGFQGLLIIIGILVAMGVDPMPVDPAMAVSGYLMALILGLGMGAINMGIMSVFPGWLWGYIVLTILVYMTSGIFFLPSMLPSELYDVMKWNPVVQIIEWVRLAYNPQLGVGVDYTYVLGWCFGSVSLGLIMERLVLRRFV
ncbi:ABC transporter [Methylobacterium sp. Leaf125]|uniref:ABC transporter permease n=1 Tax=Methylobacterium sp. Leaf125 TaxID=1736265 RepID=UPI0006FAD7F8|nr:ABC transporter permease [Methylobacterium sp. Leaf125]KQQ44952.1 ABC transporter [Methylobacterium sp. Leaf125]